MKIRWIIITSVIVSSIIVATIIWAFYNTIITEDTAWRLGGLLVGIVQIIAIYISGISFQKIIEIFKLKSDKTESHESVKHESNKSQKMPEPLKKHDVREETKNPVALAVSAIIFHKTSDSPRILFCWSDNQNGYILPGGHFYKWNGNVNKKVPAWYIDPNARPADFLLKEKLKDKYGIIARLDEDFHRESEDIRGYATIEPTPFLNLFEIPSGRDSHKWHFDFYYMCKIEFPEDSKFDDDPHFRWCSLEDVGQMVREKRTFTNLREVTVVAMDEKDKKAITDKRGEEV